jgi:hypothetical protein
VKSFTQTFNDVSLAPSSPEAVDSWHQTQGQAIIQWAQQAPSGSQTAITEAPLAQAVQNHTVTI